MEKGLPDDYTYESENKEEAPDPFSASEAPGLSLIVLMRIYDVLMTQLRYMPGVNGEKITDNLLSLHAQGVTLNPAPSFSAFAYDEVNSAEVAEGHVGEEDLS